MAAVLAGLLVPLPAAAFPRHVVSTFLCTDEYVFRLLPREKIAALSFEAADRHPVVSTISDQVKGIPLVHNSAEEVLSHNPDAAIMYAGTEERLHVQLTKAGIPIIDVPWANSIADVRTITLNLGRALGAEARARDLVTAMDRMLEAGHAQRPPIRTLIYQPNGYSESDKITDEILASAGLRDVAREMGASRSGTIPLERLVQSAPELLVLNGADDGRPSLATLMLQHPAFASLAHHVTIGRVSLTPLFCPGPWSVGIVPDLAKWGDEARLRAAASGPKRS